MLLKADVPAAFGRVLEHTTPREASKMQNLLSPVARQTCGAPPRPKLSEAWATSEPLIPPLCGGPISCESRPGREYRLNEYPRSSEWERATRESPSLE